MGIVGILFLVNKKGKDNKFLAFLKKNFLILGFIISFAAMAFSLFYSQVLNYAPCYLCWLQRIFMFPQVLLFLVAYIKKDVKIDRYAFPLLVIGSFISLYQNYLYYFGGSGNICDPSGVSCVQRLVSEFGGYISIPMMALTTFFVLMVLLVIARFYQWEKI